MLERARWHERSWGTMCGSCSASGDLFLYVDIVGITTMKVLRSLGRRDNFIRRSCNGAPGVLCSRFLRPIRYQYGGCTRFCSSNSSIYPVGSRALSVCSPFQECAQRGEQVEVVGWSQRYMSFHMSHLSTAIASGSCVTELASKKV
jgi:hypothetical protein